MGTKNEPGKFDCYSKAEPDEPVFVLLGRDPAAAKAVRFWCSIATNQPDDKIQEALKLADAMETWHIRRNR